MWRSNHLRWSNANLTWDREILNLFFFFSVLNYHRNRRWAWASRSVHSTRAGNALFTVIGKALEALCTGPQKFRPAQCSECPEQPRRPWVRVRGLGQETRTSCHQVIYWILRKPIYGFCLTKSTPFLMLPTKVSLAFLINSSS